MATISPLLQDRINGNPNKTYHEQVYKKLTTHANDVKPNEAKAKLIKENPKQAFVSYCNDLSKDVTNFKSAVKTGKLNDNSLGRLNDLGLKLGGLLIATFLAAHSKTKTEAALKFIGGGAFFASMSLWPKLFINLPAKAIHGFDIGQRYVSAQGDKKDFFLDNQFLPWDAYSDEELAEIGKRTGIDINSENGKEKIQRKMQKTALQNRTLWMATAGFSTPLMSALLCDAIEPHVKNGIINSDFAKVQKLANKSELEGYIKEAGEIVRNQTELEDLLKTTDASSEGFFEGIAKLINLDNLESEFKSTDLTKPISSHRDSQGKIVEALKNFYNETATLSISDKNEGAVVETITKYAKKPVDLFASAENALGSFSKEEAEELLKTIKKNGGTPNAITQALNEKGVTEEGINSVLKALTFDASTFNKQIALFNKTTVAQTRGKIKRYLELLNPVLGENAESKSTQKISSSLNNLFKKLNLDFGKLKELKENAIEETGVLSNKNTPTLTQQLFGEMLDGVEYGSDEYKNLINELVGTSPVQQQSKFGGNIISSAKTYLQNMQKQDNFFGEAIKKVQAIFSSNPDAKEINDVADKLSGVASSIRTEASKQGLEKLNNAILGEGDSSIFKSLTDYITEQKTNLTGFSARSAICANFEARLKAGKILINQQDIRNNPTLLEAAKKLIYEGNQSIIENAVDIPSSDSKGLLNSLKEALFNADAFKDEPEIVRQAAKEILEQNGSQTENYLLNVNFSSQIKKFATSLYNNKSWKKIFIPMSVALVAITLLAQPFFGKIDKEYKKEGGNK